jgi:hypothetical protein
MIIGIVGKARSGKDTFAEMLAEEIFNEVKHRFVLMAYAQELKLRVQKDFDLSYDQLWGDSKETPDERYENRRFWTTCTGTTPPEDVDYEPVYWTPREMMQSYGEFYRSIDNEFWVKNLFRTIEEKEYKNVIVTDVRHPNEADPIVERDGYIIKVTSDRSDKEKIHGYQHISETAMDNYDKVDFHVRNDAGLQELNQSAKDVTQFLIKAVRMKEKLEG